MQESINWLISKGKLDEADLVIRRVARFNKKAVPDVLFDKEDAEGETVNWILLRISIACNTSPFLPVTSFSIRVSV